MTRRVIALPWFLRWLTILLTGVLVGSASTAVIRYLLAPVVTVDGKRLSWVDWSVLSGVALAVLALGVTLVQVIHLQTTAEAGRAAVDRALTRLGRGELLMDFQVLRSLEYDHAVAPGADAETVQRWIREVRDVSARVVTTLRTENGNDPLIPEIEVLRETATEARLVIMGGRRNLDLWVVTRKLREGLVPTSDLIATRMNEMRLDVREEETHDAG